MVSQGSGAVPHNSKKLRRVNIGSQLDTNLLKNFHQCNQISLNPSGCKPFHLKVTGLVGLSCISPSCSCCCVTTSLKHVDNRSSIR